MHLGSLLALAFAAAPALAATATCNADDCLRALRRSSTKAYTDCATPITVPSYAAACSATPRFASACSCLPKPTTTSPPGPDCTKYFYLKVVGGPEDGWHLRLPYESASVRLYNDGPRVRFYLETSTGHLFDSSYTSPLRGFISDSSNKNGSYVGALGPSDVPPQTLQCTLSAPVTNGPAGNLGLLSCAIPGYGLSGFRVYQQFQNDHDFIVGDYEPSHPIDVYAFSAC